MLTMTIDGLWVLQVLTGIEVVAPELGLRPHFPSVEAPEMALTHPAAAELRSTGAIGANGEVDHTVAEWLTVLARRDLALLLHAQIRSHAEELDQVLLARFARWWVALERFGDLVELSAAGTATTEQSAGLVIGGQIDRLCGKLSPAEFRPVTLDADQLISAVERREGLEPALRQQRLSDDQVRALVVAGDPERSAQISIVAIQSGVGSAVGRTHIGNGAVTVIDSPAGRLIVEHTKRDGRSWMIAAPGSNSNIAAAVQKMLRRLPAQDNWHSYRKAV